MSTKVDRSALLGRALIGFIASLSLLLSSSAAAQQLNGDRVPVVKESDLPEVEILRDAADVVAIVRPRPDIDTVNTALVFHNPHPTNTTIVRCVGFNRSGVPVGRARVRVAGNGVNLILASDFSDGSDYIGSARCGSRVRIIPTGFIVGTALTDVRVDVHQSWSGTVIRYPIIASF